MSVNVCLIAAHLAGVPCLPCKQANLKLCMWVILHVFALLLLVSNQKQQAQKVVTAAAL